MNVVLSFFWAIILIPVYLYYLSWMVICCCGFGIENLLLFIISIAIKLVLKQVINSSKWNNSEFSYVNIHNHGLISKGQDSVEWKEISPGRSRQLHVLMWNNCAETLTSLVFPMSRKNLYQLYGLHDFILRSDIEENRTNRYMGSSNKMFI